MPPESKENTEEDFLERLRGGLVCPQPKDVRTAATQLAPLLPENLTLLLDGELGAGKTFFATALAEALGVSEPVTSPTYDIIATYRGTTRNLIHLDAYRMNTATEAEALGLEDLLEPPWLLLIEWPDHVPDIRFGQTWRLRFRESPGGGRLLQLEI